MKEKEYDKIIELAKKEEREFTIDRIMNFIISHGIEIHKRNGQIFFIIPNDFPIVGLIQRLEEIRKE